MFGNEFIDYCAKNYADLIKLSSTVTDELTLKYLCDFARLFVICYRHLLENKNVSIPTQYFISIGLDFQKICLLVFLISVRQGNQSISISPDLSSVTYKGQQ